MTRQARDNGPTDEDLREAFSGILDCYTELASEQGTYMQRCREIREQMAHVYDVAKDKGVTKKVLKAKVAEHRLKLRVQKCRDDLEADEQKEFDDIVPRLGSLADLPLGVAALESAKGQQTLDGLNA